MSAHFFDKKSEKFSKISPAALASRSPSTGFENYIREQNSEEVNKSQNQTMRSRLEKHNLPHNTFAFGRNGGKKEIKSKCLVI